MSVEEIKKLDDPRKEDYDERTWAAIAYARDWAMFRGEIPDQDVRADFEKFYSPREREQIIATIRIMDFANRTMNTFNPPLDRQKAFAGLEKN